MTSERSTFGMRIQQSQCSPSLHASSRGEECEHDKSGKCWTNYKQFSAYEGQVENSSLVKWEERSGKQVLKILGCSILCS